MGERRNNNLLCDKLSLGICKDKRRIRLTHRYSRAFVNWRKLQHKSFTDSTPGMRTASITEYSLEEGNRERVNVHSKHLHTLGIPKLGEKSE